MNPTNGFPLDILDYESFIESVDPGIRFLFICKAIHDDHPELKHSINHYSSEEYFESIEKLSRAILCDSPTLGAKMVCEWARTEPSIISLLEEEECFNFSLENQPTRLIFSRFIRYQQDKLRNPEIFCWPGAYFAGTRCSELTTEMLSKHQAIFRDDADGDIYIRNFENIDEDVAQNTLNTFYSWVAIYDLTRQWIISEGEFEFDYFWLSSKHSQDQLRTWASQYFIMAYGVSPENFNIL